MKIFKIQRSDGLFSTGGMYPSFKGKIWDKRNHVTNHLNQFSERDKKDYYSDCKVVEYEVIETPVEEVNVFDWKPTEKTLQRHRATEERRSKYAREQKQAEIRRLEEQLKKLKT